MSAYVDIVEKLRSEGYEYSHTNGWTNQTTRPQLRDKIAYQLTHQRIGRIHTTASLLEKLTGFDTKNCYKIAEAIFNA